MFTIGQIAKTAAISPSAIRFYESVGLLPKPERIGGQRRYSLDILKHIRIIQIAQQAGFQVQEIRTLIEGFDANIAPSERWKQLAKQKKQDLEIKKRQIEQMEKVLDDGLKCACLSFEDCFVNVGVADIVVFSP